jgi:hypothetical protein
MFQTEYSIVSYECNSDTLILFPHGVTETCFKIYIFSGNLILNIIQPSILHISPNVCVLSCFTYFCQFRADIHRDMNANTRWSKLIWRCEVPRHIASPLLNASERTGLNRTLRCGGYYSYFIFCKYWVQISIRVRTIMTDENFHRFPSFLWSMPAWCS